MNIYALLFMMLEAIFLAMLIIVALLYIALILTAIYFLPSLALFRCWVTLKNAKSKP